MLAFSIWLAAMELLFSTGRAMGVLFLGHFVLQFFGEEMELLEDECCWEFEMGFCIAGGVQHSGNLAQVTPAVPQILCFGRPFIPVRDAP